MGVSIRLAVHEIRATSSGWLVAVKLSITNEGRATFDLDKVTVCNDGHIGNWVFKVHHGAKQLEYQGEMGKRAPPGRNGFVHLAAGQTYSTVVKLDEVFRFPTEGGEFSVQFDSMNHFSKDAEQLTSPALTLLLVR